MADKKITELAVASSVAATDVVPVVDLSGTPTTKKATVSNLLASGASYTQTLTNKTISGADNTISALAASVVTSGTFAHERGGLEADVSAYNGLVRISGGATSAVTAPTGTIVGTSDSQTLTNKNLTSPLLTGTLQLQESNITAIAVTSATTVGNLNSSFAAIRTSSVTPTTVFTFAVADETVVALDYKVTCARRTNATKGGRYKGSVVYRRTSAGAPTIVGAAEYGTDQETTAGDGVAFVVSGNNIQVVVTAADTDPRNWIAEVSVHEALVA